MIGRPTLRRAAILHQVSPYVMDATFLVTQGLAWAGVSTLPAWLVPYVLVPSYLAIFWLYRQVRTHGLGSGGAPLLAQLGVRLPSALETIGLWIGLLLYFVFPFYAGTLMAMSFDPALGDPARWPAWLKLVTAVLLLALCVYTWVCLASEREPGRELPVARQDLLLRLVLPVTALLLGEGTAALSALVEARLSPDPGAQVTLALAVFIPLRLVLTRTAGASRLQIVTFLLTSASSVAGALLAA